MLRDPAPEFKDVSVENLDKIRAQANELNKRRNEAKRQKEELEQKLKELNTEIQKSDSEFYNISSANRDRADLYIRAVEQKEIVKDSETILKPTDASLATDAISFKADKKILAELKEQDRSRVDALVNLLYLVCQKFKFKKLAGSYSILKENLVGITFSYREHGNLIDHIALTYFEKQGFNSTGGLGCVSHDRFEIPNEKVEQVINDLKEKSYADLLKLMLSDLPEDEHEDFLEFKIEDVIKIASETNNRDDFEKALYAKKVEARQKIEDAKVQREQVARQHALELEEKARQEARERAAQDKAQREEQVKQAEARVAELKEKELAERKTQPNACRGLMTAVAGLFRCRDTRPKSQAVQTSHSQETKRSNVI